MSRYTDWDLLEALDADGVQFTIVRAALERGTPVHGGRFFLLAPLTRDELAALCCDGGHPRRVLRAARSRLRRRGVLVWGAVDRQRVDQLVAEEVARA